MTHLHPPLRALAVVAGLGLAGAVVTACSSDAPVSTASSTTVGSSAPPAGAAAGDATFLDANGVDLNGDWVSTQREARTIEGIRTGSETLTVTEQQGAVFLVSRDLEIDVEGELGGSGPPTRKLVDHPLLGLVNVDGSITMVKKGDGGQLNGWLTDRNTMVLSYTEGGDEPAVARVTVVRAAGTTTGTATGTTGR